LSTPSEIVDDIGDMQIDRRFDLLLIAGPVGQSALISDKLNVAFSL